jgi:hypothetical protein
MFKLRGRKNLEQLLVVHAIRDYFILFCAQEGTLRASAGEDASIVNAGAEAIGKAELSSL